MNRDKDMPRGDLAKTARTWIKPSVARLSAGAAEVGIRTIVSDGPLSSFS